MKLYKSISSILCFTLLWFSSCSSLLAQKEAANWYFGDNAGVTFLNGFPEALTDGALDTLEGCATISDVDGNLLFYTDGVAVWNRNHNVMPNGFGLLGSFSSTQSALIVPKPGTDNLYYIFTSDVVQAYQNTGVGNGLNYSLVDMEADDGLGDIIEMNTNLLPETSEKLTGIFAANGEDYWVITHYQDSFYSYRVTNLGIDVIPVVSTVGEVISDFNNIRGQMKIAPNGKKMALAHTVFKPELGGGLYLYDFDTGTGIVSNEEILDDLFLHYGVEFSNNSKVLYSSAKNIVSEVATETPYIFQYNLEEDNISNSMLEIASFDATTIDLAGQLQLAVDRKIYHALPQFSLSVIREPNLIGELADFRQFDAFLGGERARFGLPPFLQSFFESVFEIDNLCLNQEVSFTITLDDIITSVLWDFGDPNSSSNSSTAIQPTHVFSGPGTYLVSVEIDFENKPNRTFSELVTILGPPETVDVQVSGNTGSTTIEIIVPNPDDFLYSIDEGETLQQSPIFPFLAPGFYTIQIWREGCLVFETTQNVGGLPNYFTPNGDGYHDLWRIPGVARETTYVITIFDRYGKVLKQLTDAEEGWDGTYEGKKMPSNDYWYTVEFSDGKKVSGNFSLKR